MVKLIGKNGVTYYVNPDNVESVKMQDSGAEVTGVSGTDYDVRLDNLEALVGKLEKPAEKTPTVNLQEMNKKQLVTFAADKKIEVDPKAKNDEIIAQIIDGLGD